MHTHPNHCYWRQRWRLPRQEFPFPLFTAVIDPYSSSTQETNITPPYEWVEASPYYLASDYLHATVPLRLFGNRFLANRQQTSWPEQRLGYYLGVFGSPYAFTIGDAIRAFAEDVENLSIREILFWIAGWHANNRGRISPATPPNYTFHVEPHISPLENAANAHPECDFRYVSNCFAQSILLNAIQTTNSQGLSFLV